MLGVLGLHARCRRGKRWLFWAALAMLVGVAFAPAGAVSLGMPQIVLESSSPVADAYVSAQKPAVNFGQEKSLRVAGPGASTGEFITYLRFTVADLGPVSNAILRLHILREGDTAAISPVADNSWSESAITYGNRPVINTNTALPFVPGPRGAWVEVDVSELVTAAGTVSLAIHSSELVAATFDSRESANTPLLLVEYGPAGTPTATPSLTPTVTASLTPTWTPTITPTITASPTLTPTVTATATAAPSSTPTLTPTATLPPSATPTEPPSPTATATEPPSPTPTETVPPSPTATEPPSPTPTVTATATATPTPQPSPTWTPLPTWTPTPGAGGFYFPPPGEALAMQDIRTPAEVGIDPALINVLNTRTSKWALWRHGYLVHVQGNFNAAAWTKSLRKTFHAATVGAAIQQGLIPSLDQPLSVWQTELVGNDALATWEDVIIQASGFDYPGCGDNNDYLPGQMWNYSDLNPFNLNHALAKVYGKTGYYDNYEEVLEAAYFDTIGMQGWDATPANDGVRLFLDLEDMGRFGLLMVAGGQWDGQQVLPAGFTTAMTSQQTAGMQANYEPCNSSGFSFSFPEAPYGYMTWTNENGDYYPGASTGWAWGWGAGGYYLLWNADTGIVFAGMAVRNKDTDPTPAGIPHFIDDHILGENPLFGE